jgi:hypothetical protein
MRTSTTLACSLLLIGSSFAPQDPASKEYVFTAGEHRLRELISHVANVLQWTILHSEQELAQVADPDLVLQRDIRLDRVGYEQVLGQLLYHKGFALIPIDPERQIWEVIYMNGPKRSMLRTHAQLMSVEAVERNANRWIPVLVHVPLQHIEPAGIAAELNRFLEPDARPELVTSAAGSRQVLVCDFAPRVAQIVKLLAQLDVPAEIGAAGAPDLTWPGRVERRLEQLEARVAGLQKR